MRNKGGDRRLSVKPTVKLYESRSRAETQKAKEEERRE